MFLLLLKFFFSSIYLIAPSLSHSMWDLVPWPGIEPGSHAFTAQNSSHWTTREVPKVCVYFFWMESFSTCHLLVNFVLFSQARQKWIILVPEEDEVALKSCYNHSLSFTGAEVPILHCSSLHWYMSWYPIWIVTFLRRRREHRACTSKPHGS